MAKCDDPECQCTRVEFWESKYQEERAVNIMLCARAVYLESMWSAARDQARRAYDEQTRLWERLDQERRKHYERRGAE